MSCKLRKIRRDNQSYLPTNNCNTKKSCIIPAIPCIPISKTCEEVPCSVGEFLETSSPCVPVCSLDTSVPNCVPSTLETRLCSIEENINILLNKIVQCSPPPCTQTIVPPPSPCEVNPHCPPPIIFDGYDASLRRININCNECEYWFLIPNQCTTSDTYKFYWNENLSKYIYEPVFSNDLTRSIPYCYDNNYHITYVYDDLGEYGWGLKPLKYTDKLLKPLSITAYRYTAIPLCGHNTFVWCFIPVPFCFSEPIVPNFFQPLTYPCNKNECLPEPINLCYDCNENSQCPDKCDSGPNIIKEIKNLNCPYNKCLNYKFNPITTGIYYNVIPTNIKPNIFKFSDSILDCSGNPECVLITPNVSGFMLPNDCHKYNITWLPELRINSTTAAISPLTVAPIYGLAGTFNTITNIDGNDTLPADCIIELDIFYLDEECNVINSEIIATSIINWQSICLTPPTGLSDLPPTNFTVFQTTINSNLVSYYKSCSTTNCITFCNTPKCSKKLLAIRVTAGFSVENVKVEINRIIC